MKILHVGNTANYAYQIAKYLRESGVDADLLIKCGAKNTENPASEDLELTQSSNRPEWVKQWNPKNPLDWIRIARMALGYDMLHVYAGVPAYAQFSSKPYVAWSLGSDLRKVSFEKTLRGRLLKRGFSKARLVLSSDVNYEEIANGLGLKNVVFMPQGIDTEKYAPRKNKIRGRYDCDLLVFHPARQHWAVKGNDRLIRAFAKLVKGGFSAHMILVDWGVDNERAKRLIAELGIKKYAEFRPVMDTKTLIDYYGASDIVADQFLIGSYGYVGLGAMSCATPVLMHLLEDNFRKCYGTLPPILNANEEGAIYEKLLYAAKNKSELKRRGEESRRWVIKNHRWAVIINRLIEIYRGVIEK